MDKEQILKRIRTMFDVPVMQNNLRGLNRLSGGEVVLQRTLVHRPSLSRLSGGEECHYWQNNNYFNALERIRLMNHIFKEQWQAIVIEQLFRRGQKDPRKIPA